MFAAPRDLRVRKRSESRSTDEHSSTQGVVRKGLPTSPAPPRYAREPSTSSHSLATTSSHPDDHSGATSGQTQSSSTHSAQSTPISPPSTGYDSRFPGSQSSATSVSESLPRVDTSFRSEFGLLNSEPHSAHASMPGSAFSRSSLPASPRFRSTTESYVRSSARQSPHRSPPENFSTRPSTAPHPSSVEAKKNSNSPVEQHSRSHSRLTVGIKNLLVKPSLPSPSRFSLNSAATRSDSEVSSRSHTPNSKTARPPDLDVSASTGVPLPRPRSPTHPADVHRRYASETTKVYKSRTDTAPPASQESLETDAHPPPRGKPRNVLRRRPSSAKLPKGGKRERESSHPKDDADLPINDGLRRLDTMSAELTPAGAVVEAYKRQELHREDVSSPTKPSTHEQFVMSPKHSTEIGRAGDAQAEGSPTPYYTVFGTSSERRVRAGGPEDRWSRFEGQMTGQRTWVGTSIVSQPETGGRSLTRKVSSRWKKVKGGSVATEQSPTRGEVKGRPSFQEAWSGKKSIDRDGRTFGRSMDGGSDLRQDVWTGTHAVSHARSGSEKGEAKEGVEGGKLWRLMKRISTGGLRDRFQVDKVVPPVPAIPKELLGKVNQGDRHDNYADSGWRHPSTSRVSPHRKSDSSQEREHAVTMPKPSFATSSSSHNSSDVASAQFFQKNHSPRSSISSYGEVTVPPVPEITLDRHIITPLEQLRLGGDHVDSSPTISVPRSPRRSTSVPSALRTADHANGEDVPLPSPRRLTHSGDSPQRSSFAPASTSSPSSMPKSELRTKNGRPLLADGAIALSPPPPRPPRSARRVAGSVGSPAYTSSPKHADIGDVSRIDRAPSVQSDVTAKPDTPSVSQLTFRELNTPRRPPLTEREKADIWDDLLARSEKAGGTLHIGASEGELMSDSMRFSTYSEFSMASNLP